VLAPKRMGNGIQRPAVPPVPAATLKVPVTLHIYDLGTHGGMHMLNSVLRRLGSGMVHCGVEIHGLEWSFSGSDGVFYCGPKECEGHTFSDSHAMGITFTTKRELARVIEVLEKKWPVAGYDILHRNCCHFSNALCLMLGVGSIPSWVMSLAEAAARVTSAGDVLNCCTRSRGAAWDSKLRVKGARVQAVQREENDTADVRMLCSAALSNGIRRL